MADHGEVKLRDVRIQNLIDVYHQAYANIVETILQDTTAGKIKKARTMAAIRGQLQDLGDDVDSWVKKEIPQYYLDGANVAVQDLKKMGVDLSGPAGLAPINKEAIASLVDDTALAFAQSLTAISRNAEALLGDAVKQQLNFIIANGQLTGEARKTIAASIKQSIEDNGISALVDKGGRSWAFDTYAEMLVRTKAVESRNAGLQNKMLQNGYDLVQVSDHSSDHPECAQWEGQILSVTGETPGYPTTDDAEADGLMHPNCQHAYNVINEDLASLTQSYDNPYNYDDAGADESEPTESRGTGKTQQIPVFHGSGGNPFSEPGTDLFGNAFYVARDKSTAAEFGKVSAATLNIKSSQIMTIASDAEYSKLIISSLKQYPGEDIATSLPKYVQSLGYKAVEGTKDYDRLAGIAVFDKSLIK